MGFMPPARKRLKLCRWSSGLPRMPGELRLSMHWCVMCVDAEIRFRPVMWATGISLRALAGGGRSDVIFDMNNQSEKPGYGYQIAHGATSLTEAWDSAKMFRRITSCSDKSSSGFITIWRESSRTTAGRVSSG